MPMDNRLLRPRRRIAVGSATLLTQGGEVLLTEDDEELMTDDGSLDADALAYIAAVEAADGQALEQGVRDAFAAFITGCKSDGIWSAIKASCILAGARTLAGAFVPLVGTAPTNNNFVSGDYNRETGLAGDGSTKYLNSNRSGSADSQNNHHIACWVSTASTAAGSPNLMGTDGLATAGGTNLFEENNSGDLSGHSRGDGDALLRFLVAGGNTATGLKGITRAASASYTVRVNGSNSTFNLASSAPTNRTFFVFARNDASNPPQFVSDARLAFYSIGESLDLALLDDRVSALITAIGAAIP